MFVSARHLFCLQIYLLLSACGRISQHFYNAWGMNSSSEALWFQSVQPAIKWMKTNKITPNTLFPHLSLPLPSWSSAGICSNQGDPLHLAGHLQPLYNTGLIFIFAVYSIGHIRFKMLWKYDIISQNTEAPMEADFPPGSDRLQETKRRKRKEDGAAEPEEHRVLGSSERVQNELWHWMWCKGCKTHRCVQILLQGSIKIKI